MLTDMNGQTDREGANSIDNMVLLNNTNFRSSDSEDLDDLDSEGFTGRTGDIFGDVVPDPTSHPLIEKYKKMNPSGDVNGNEASSPMVPFEDEYDDIDVGSDEERSIIAEIKAEITNKVRDEMRNELMKYKHSTSEDEKRDDTSEKTGQEEEEDEMEPKLKAALLKMRKLDKILRKKVEREKEVKRDRIMLQRSIKDQLAQLGEQRKEVGDERKNTEKYLALALPPSHNDGVILDSWEDPIATPVFKTQYLDDDLENSEENSNANAANGKRRPSDTSTEALGGKASSNSRKPHRKHGKDFIKRNVELAGDAAEAIAMTAEEKQRLEELLKDIDDETDNPVDEAEMESIYSGGGSSSSNPYQIVLAAGEGFQPLAEEMRRLEEIDRKLQALMPPAHFASIRSPSTSITTPHPPPSQVVSLPLRSSVDIDKLGEKALQEVKDDRDLQQRLNAIDDRLREMAICADLEIESPQLTEDQLNSLLEECARSLSRSTFTGDMTDRSDASTIAELMEHPPKLPDHVLQELLSQSTIYNANSGILTKHITEDDLVLESIAEERLLEAEEKAALMYPFVSDIGLTPANDKEYEEDNASILSPKSPQLQDEATLFQRVKMPNGIMPRSTSDNSLLTSVTSLDDAAQLTNRSNIASPHHSVQSPTNSRPFLPSIWPSGTMTAHAASSNQAANSMECTGSRPNSSGRSSAVSITERHQFRDRGSKHLGRKSSNDSDDDRR